MESVKKFVFEFHKNIYPESPLYASLSCEIGKHYPIIKFTFMQIYSKFWSWFYLPALWFSAKNKFTLY